ncbi:class I SAM-dependent DNA methyltransferase [Sphingomonas sp. M1-B02]|uniref:class I SAM-dependent DNA methyltransferase n=1 Tax=Sphingomonas sp. M1-B02 TaxID=3114300 RepID=UPI002240BF8A|nr:DNA methyltransferase [Sphingomonas sp. S6-11]UZK64755.1 class I SAM-dependent DNA methyltransferase [Sphingomonas sp. S6-11]
MTVDEFIEKWSKSGGNERANTHLFVNDLCALIGVREPQPTRSDAAANDYVYERNVIKTEIDGTTSNGWIDCYKRDSFILEAKQGSAADIEAVEKGQGDSLRDFFGQTAGERFKRGMAKRGTGQWTGAMQRAAGQAEGYAKALPADHGWPPFLLITDVGYCIDVYSDFARSGKGYAPFPDRRRFRITLEDLRDEQVRERLRDIWDRPMALDPSAEAARVTRGIADHLATLARRIEAREQNPDRTAAFLMRLLFTMFAEDTGLIPKHSFSALLKKVRDRPENLPPMLADLWAKMDTGGFVGALGDAGETVRKFNGYLFKETAALPLEPEEIDVLIAAASADWRQVEPAIFGTLLERALDVKERAKLGAHYTPRAYVERLVGPTIMEPLREDWIGARAAATEAAEAGDKDGARKIVETFHGKLAQTKVLDPACGTGNFLYVAMARMKELEGEVLELLQELGDDQYLAEISGHTITPENFLGIEINPRAANIAQLVLWIGYLQWHFRVNGEDRMPPDPVLRDVKTIENRDALITWDKRELERDEAGKPVTRWDGETMKLHPVTGKNVPDETARVEVYRYVNPKAAKWPKADFIIGNPPFIGSKRMRAILGDTYVDAIQQAQSDIPEASDFVLRWWHVAAAIVGKGHARRAGLIGTNSITQAYNRRIVERHLASKSKPVSLVYAIADHPWVDEGDGAAVRISMSVIAAGEKSGSLIERVANGDATLPIAKIGYVGADFRVGADVASAKALRASEDLCCVGMKVIGDGFVISREQRNNFATESDASLEEFVRPYLNGRDLSQRSRDVFVIDFFGHSEAWVQSRFPALYNHLISTVKPERVQSRNDKFARDWWVIGHPRPLFRRFTADLRRYVATLETAKHRFFVFLSVDTAPDSALVTFGLDDAYALGVLSSQFHLVWALAAGGRLGVGNDPRYNKSRCFDPFPFPDTTDEALKDRIRDAAEKLDALRKDVLARHEDLTLTKLYNVLEALRAAEKAGTVLSDKDRDMASRGCVSLIRQYHDTIDAAVAEAYGWPADLTDEQILEELVALNKVRAAEEAKGEIKWLRPDFQKPGYSAPREQKTLALPETVQPTADILAWPAALPDRFVAVAAVVDRAARPIAANDVARAFKGTNAKGVGPVLDTLAGMGRLRKLEDGRYAA